MNRVAILIIILVLGGYANQLHASNPGDLTFQIRLVADSHTFHVGESISLEIAYSSATENKYEGSFSKPTPEFSSVKVELTPEDALADFWSYHNMIGGSYLQGLGYLSSQPKTVKMDLSDWCHFRKAGHYSVRLGSSAVSRIKSLEEGGGRERLTLESNSVDFDILPPDAAWAAEQQAKFQQVLNTQQPDGKNLREALERLSKLDTDASAQALVNFYLSHDSPVSWEADYWLRESDQLDVVIRSLQMVLTNPTANAPQGIEDLLATLQTRGELGVVPPYSDDPAKQLERQRQLEEQTKTHWKYLGQANDLLVASLEKRTGSDRAAAVYLAWGTAEDLNRTNGVSQETLVHLRSTVVSVQYELPHNLQRQFVMSGWQTLPHQALLPLLQKLAKESLEQSYASAEDVRLWCEAEPQQCNNAVIDSVRIPEHKPSKFAILLLTESEHPELDEPLREELHGSQFLLGSPASQSTAAVLLRAGSQSLMPDVRALLNKLPLGDAPSCEIEGDLLAYMFRFNSKEAGKRLNFELQAGNGNHCGSELLGTLHNDRYSDDLNPIVTAALDSPNLTTAGSAAVFLTERAPASAEEALWRRLERLRNTWRENSSQLQNVSPVSVDAANSPQYQAARLEQALASALVKGKNWKLSSDGIERLRAGCMTDQCRSIADGKMSLSM